MRLLKFTFVLSLLLTFSPSYSQTIEDDFLQHDEAVTKFIGLLLFDTPTTSKNLDYLENNWQKGFESMALEVMRLSRNSELTYQLFDLLRKNTGMDIGNSLDEWLQWMWTQPEQKYEHFGSFKSLMYRMVDEKFKFYFNDERQTTIRLDEVIWGGVQQDGIPPLRQPEMISAEEAEYLEGDNVVFGVEINGDARAYPKRILAWHEMFVDTIGGVDFAGVYCTLCGAVILYETELEGVNYEMGTSGFLYRSNKLMYDKKTQSLWNTTWGQPVVGPLVGKGIELKRSYVVTTTWGEWKRRHPETTVLSLQTGHRRNYGEGVAYRSYFSTDELMFTVPKIDSRLKNKAEILALIFPEQSRDTLAIASAFLNNETVYHDELGGLKFVVLTDGSGANRVYQTDGVKFTHYDGDDEVVDSQGQTWKLSEDSLTGENGENLIRLAAHRAFWFGWVAANSDTRLVH